MKYKYKYRSNHLYLEKKNPSYSFSRNLLDYIFWSGKFNKIKYSTTITIATCFLEIES